MQKYLESCFIKYLHIVAQTDLTHEINHDMGIKF